MSSNIEMNRFRVLDACDAYIENADRHVKKVRETEIEKKMKPISIFGFKLFGMSYEKAKKSLEQDLWTEYNLIQFQGGAFLERVKNLKVACELSTAENIFVDVKDVRMLQPFLK